MARRHARGFTLAEVAVVVTAAAVIAAIGMITLSQAQKETAHQNEAEALVSVVQEARATAIRLKRPVCVVTCTDENTAAIIVLKRDEDDCWSYRASIVDPGESVPPNAESLEHKVLSHLNGSVAAYSFKPPFVIDNDTLIVFGPDGQLGGVQPDGKSTVAGGVWPDPPNGLTPSGSARYFFSATDGATPTTEEGTVLTLTLGAAGAISSTITKSTFADYVASGTGL
jgi:prepilin-type N-terminal cleavage/methylation domain-containing protein